MHFLLPFKLTWTAERRAPDCNFDGVNRESVIKARLYLPASTLGSLQYVEAEDPDPYGRGSGN